MVHRIDNNFMGERGVSPVIGVILMVSITVILAAIVGQYVLDLSSILQEPPQAGVSINEEYDEFNGTYDVRVLVTAMPNADAVIIQCAANCGGSFSSTTFTEVGDAETFTGLPQGAEIVVIGELGGEGNRQVVRTYQVGGE